MTKKDENSWERDPLLGAPMKVPYPKSVFLIFVTEFCERFSFFGMRAVLILYLTTELDFSDRTATLLYHTFTMLVFLTPLFGGILADSYLGKFKTILYLSTIYAIGNITLSSAATPVLHLPALPFSLLGLFLIALGTGGIRPCVSAFGGDQFHIPSQQAQLRQYFYIFYFTVNMGALISTLVTPIFREDLPCFGEDSCFPLAFGVPACLMIIALVIFVLGKPAYKIKVPKGNVLVLATGCIYRGITNRKSERIKTGHWLDRAGDKYDKQFVQDLKQLLKILILFIPFPMYWALHEQCGSSWTLQATRMNGHLGKGYILKPDQMQALNPLLILLFIPLFESVLYPLFDKCNFLRTPLQRMTLGAFLTAVSFILAGVLELHLQSTYANQPDMLQTNLNFVNTVPCSVNVSLIPVTENNDLRNLSSQILPFDNFIHTRIPAINYSVHIEPGEECLVRGGRLTPAIFTIGPKSGNAYSILITLTKGAQLTLLVPEAVDDLQKDETGDSKLKVIHTELLEAENASLLLNPSGVSETTANFSLGNLAVGSDTVVLPPIAYSVVLLVNHKNQTSLGYITLGSSGNYLLVLFRNQTGGSSEIMRLYVLTQPNSVSMLLQLPQYFVAELAEVLFLVTGFTFAYTQAPNSMKSVIQSFWYLMNAIGNLIVVIATQGQLFKEQANQFFAFSALMFLAAFLLLLLAVKYNPFEAQPTTPTFRVRSGSRTKGGTFAPLLSSGSLEASMNE